MNGVKMISVSSSNVHSVGYDKQSQLVYVRFHTPSLYVYEGVPESEFQNLLSASSCGTYIHQKFVGVYPYKKLE